MTFAPTWNGLNIHTAGTVVLDWSDSGPIEVKTSPLLRGGMGITRNALLGRKIKLKGLVRGSTATATTALLDNLMEDLHISGEKVLRISNDRYIDAYADPGSIKVEEGVDGKLYYWSCEFVSTSPYWRDLNELNQSVTNGAGSPVSVVATNTGKATELPDYTFAASGGGYTDITITVRNTTTSKEFRLFQLSIDNGDTLKIDSSTGEVYFTANPGSTSSAPKRIDGQFFELPNGSNTIQFTHTAGSDGFLTFKVHYTPRHHNVGNTDGA